jgi:hypothetical protein
MSKSMRVYINSDFDKRIFNTPGKLFPESDITQLDVGVFGSDGYESKLVVAFASLVNDINRIAEKNQFIQLFDVHLPCSALSFDLSQVSDVYLPCLLF